MTPRSLVATLAVALATGMALPAAAEVYRCTSRSGAVSYQESPCGGAEVARVMDLPASYPAVDAQVRTRLLEQAAEVDRRLEARRERESRESIAAMQARAVSAMAQPAPAVEPVYVYAWPRHGAGIGARARARSTRAM